MGHECHQHGRDRGQQSLSTKLLVVSLLVFVYFVAELIGGWWTGSLALLADAGHMFSDLFSLVLSLLAIWMARRAPTQQYTYGYYRAEILAALANGSLLFLVSGGILHEAWERFHSTQSILGGPMLWIALGGLVVNLLSLAVLHGGHQENLNARGAWLHVLGDTLGSLGVIVAAALIWLFGWTWADPVASVVVCLLILYSAWKLVSDATSILMEHAPRDVDVESVRGRLLEVEGVCDIHCLHVWTITSGLRALSAHVVFRNLADTSRLEELQNALDESFDLEHVTLQLESTNGQTCKNQENGACLLTAREESHTHE